MNTAFTANVLMEFQWKHECTNVASTSNTRGSERKQTLTIKLIGTYLNLTISYDICDISGCKNSIQIEL